MSLDDCYTAGVSSRRTNTDLHNRVQPSSPNSITGGELVKTTVKSASPESPLAESVGLRPLTNPNKRSREKFKENPSSPERFSVKRAKPSYEQEAGPQHHSSSPHYTAQEGSSRITDPVPRPPENIGPGQIKNTSSIPRSMTQIDENQDDSVIRPLTKWTLPVSLNEHWQTGRIRSSHARKHSEEFGLRKEEKNVYYKLASDFFQQPLQNCDKVVEVARTEGTIKKVYRFDYERGLFGVLGIREPEDSPVILTFYRPCMVAEAPEDKLPESSMEQVRLQKAAAYFEEKFPQLNFFEQDEGEQA